MKFKGFWYDSLLICLTAGISAVFIAMTVFVEPRLAIAEVSFSNVWGHGNGGENQRRIVCHVAEWWDCGNGRR